MALIFISYRSQNRTLVEPLADDLNGIGHTAWFDKELSGGQVWWEEILERIRACDVLIFALTPESLESSPCKLEYTYAISLGKPILPVMLTNVNLHTLPPALSVLQVVDYQRRDKGATMSLSRALHNFPISVSLPDPLPVPPEAPISPL